MATYWTLGCDAADPDAIAAFWATALGYVAEPPWDMVEREQLIRGKAVELVAIGARTVREEFDGGEHLGHVVMLDPEGNEFCVA